MSTAKILNKQENAAMLSLHPFQVHEETKLNGEDQLYFNRLLV